MQTDGPPIRLVRRSEPETEPEEFAVYVVQVVVAVGIVLGTVLVAGGRGDGLQPADPGRARVRLPLTGPLAPDDLQRVRLGVGLRGYRMDEVDEVMDRVVLELAQRDERIAELERMRTVAATTVPAPAPHTGSGWAPTDA